MEGLTGLEAHGIRRSKFWRDLLKFLQWTQIIILDLSRIFCGSPASLSLSKVFLGDLRLQLHWCFYFLSLQPLCSSEEEGPRRTHVSQLDQPGAAGAQGRQPVLSAVQWRHHLARKWRLFSVSSSLILEHLNENIKCFPLREFLVYYWSFTSSSWVSMTTSNNHQLLLSWFALGVTAPENPSCAVMAPRAQRSASLSSRGTEPLIMHKPRGQGFANG